MLNSDTIRQRFFDFWKSDPRNHKEIPNVSLVPNVDSTLLFVNSGMFPVAPYLGGQPHPAGNRLVNFQRCLRTKADEIEEIGDNRHTLMFEMMGQWSLGDYFKKEQIPWMLEVYVEQFELDPHRLYVSVWAGDEVVGRDDEAIALWKQAFAKYGVEAEFTEDLTKVPTNVEESANHKYRIFPYGAKDNWWERAHAPGELGGPTTEIFYDTGRIEVPQDSYDINDDSGRFLEIGNSVFMTYQLDQDMNWQPLKQKNVDFGGGFERVVMCAQGKTDIFETDIFFPVIQKLEHISGKPYKQSNGEINEYTKAFRVAADHGRIVTFLIADGVQPSNKDQGYILRRFIRRLVRFGMDLGIEENFTVEVARGFIDRMEQSYPHLREQESNIVQALTEEEAAFRKTLKNGLKELEKIKQSGEKIDGKTAFYLYETFGFPLEMTIEEIGLSSEDPLASQIKDSFESQEEEHRAQSRAGAEQKFKGGLADQSAETTKLHTTHHLLLAALRQVLGEHVHQRGSNITAERLRIDFSHDDKLTETQKAEVENLVNEWISQSLAVRRIDMPKEQAEQLGAEMEFGQKYPDTVSVYFITTEVDNDIPHTWISAEFCGGPHVSNTSEIADNNRKFKIQKEQSSSKGVRRIKGVLN